MADDRDIHPHQQGFFFRLLSMFGLTSRPDAADFSDGEDDDVARHAAMERAYRDYFQLTRNRMERYRVFDEMDTFPYVAAVLDTYSEEVTQPDYDKGRSAWIESKDAEITELGMQCLTNIRVEDVASAVTREFCKYGDAFRRLIYKSGSGVLAWKAVSPLKVHRKIDKYNRLVGFQEDGQKYRGKLGHNVSWPWDYVQFRMLGKDESLEYGSSLLEPLFRPWRMLCLAAGTKVWTVDGPVNVEDLEPGMETYCHDPHSGETRETAIKSVLNMGRQRLLKVTTAHRQIVVTENHGLLVRDCHGKFLYKRAKELIENGGVGRVNWDGFKYADSLVLPSIVFGADTHTIKIPTDNYAVRLEGAAEYGREGVMDRIRACNLTTSPKNVHAFLNAHRAIRYDDFVKLRDSFDLGPVRVSYRKGTVRAPFGEDFAFVADYRFARLFGFMLGDGWVWQDRNRCGFALGVREERNDYYMRLVRELFGVSGFISERSDDGEGGCFVFDGRPIADVFVSAGFITGYANKRIPDWVFGMSPRFKRALIQGLLEADGGEQGNGWRLNLSNRVLVEQVQTLCQQSGYKVSRVVGVCPAKQVTFPQGHTSDCRESYRIYISNDPHDESVVYEPVTHIEDAGFGPTYDVEVEDELHNFVADGVVSHNTLTEDGMLMYRLRRSADRNIVYVDVGDMSEDEAVSYVNRWRKRYRKHEFIDPASKDYKTQYNPLTPVEDIFVPTRADKRSVQHEPWSAGGSDPNFVYDLEHHRNTFFGAARIPKAYVGLEGEVNAKATLLQQDVRFARTCKRVRKTLVYGLRTVTDIHLALQAKGQDLVKRPYVVQMSPISYLDEFERLELVELRYRIVDSMSRLHGELKLDPRAWATYILTDFAKLPDSMVAKLIAKTDPADKKDDGESSSNLTPKQRYSIVERYGEDMLDRIEGSMTDGAHELTLEERRLVGRAIHESPALRRIIGDIRYYMEDDLNELQALQIDPSRLPPQCSGVLLEDSYQGDDEGYKLRLHLKTLQAAEEGGDGD